MKYYLIAGERSGDLHASNLMKALKSKDANAEFRFWGGDYMQAVGGKMVVHYRQLAFMGFLEVLLNLFTISKFIKQCKKDIAVYQPDVLILVDYGGFNLKIAKYAKSIGLKIVYYISPKVWAWNQKRAYKIKDRVDKMLCILPFEVAFYKKFNWEVEYVGNPVVEAVKAHKTSKNFFNENSLGKIKGIIAILPGSRKQEVTRILPTLIPVIANFPAQHFVIAGVDNLPSELYYAITRLPNASLLIDKTYDVLANAKAAIVCSGTATLETALFNVPQVIVYKAGGISYYIAKAMIKVDYIGLANLIVGEEVVKELIQGDCTTENITQEVQNILKNGTDYKELNKVIGDKVASTEAAESIIRAYGNWW
ncbi:MAG: lipid-A-disaccharide synthase [Cyclobacteriaceae bacterium]|nr:lipid-A-disaccharide synthase [Cyclobacteriaceae bacterium]